MNNKFITVKIMFLFAIFLSILDENIYIVLFKLQNNNETCIFKIKTENNSTTLFGDTLVPYFLIS